MTVLPELPDGFSYVTDGIMPCRIVICDAETGICRTEHGHPVDAAVRAVEELRKEAARTKPGSRDGKARQGGFIITATAIELLWVVVVAMGAWRAFCWIALLPLHLTELVFYSAIVIAAVPYIFNAGVMLIEGALLRRKS